MSTLFPHSYLRCLWLGLFSGCIACFLKVTLSNLLSYIHYQLLLRFKMFPSFVLISAIFIIFVFDSFFNLHFCVSRWYTGHLFIITKFHQLPCLITILSCQNITAEVDFVLVYVVPLISVRLTFCICLQERTFLIVVGKGSFTIPSFLLPFNPSLGKLLNLYHLLSCVTFIHCFLVVSIF